MFELILSIIALIISIITGTIVYGMYTIVIQNTKKRLKMCNIDNCEFNEDGYCLCGGNKCNEYEGMEE